MHTKDEQPGARYYITTAIDWPLLLPPKDWWLYSQHAEEETDANHLNSGQATIVVIAYLMLYSEDAAFEHTW